VGCDPRQQIVRIERFADVVHSPGFETLELVDDFIQTADKDHRDVAELLVGLQPTADFIAVQTGHEHIQQNQVGSLDGHGPQG